jgi:hypothetical protein
MLSFQLFSLKILAPEKGNNNNNNRGAVVTIETG